MYDKIKVLFANPTYRYYIIGALIVFLCVCAGYILYQPSGADYHRAVDAVERAQEQQRESLELNRSIQHSIDRSTEYSHEAKERIDRSSQYNNEIGKRISQSQGNLSEARNYLERNAELFRHIERESRERQSNNQTPQDATQSISDGRSGSNNRSGNSSMNER